MMNTPIYDAQFIGGKRVTSQATAFIEVEDPNTGLIAAHTTTGHAADVDLAIRAAADAFPAWSATSPEERGAVVRRFKERLEARREDLAVAVAAEVGTPLKISRMVQVDAPIQNVENFLGIASSFHWQTRVGNSLVFREPHGVVACITPWNFPVHQIVLKIVPAVLAGNTVVLKPSEITPRVTALLCDAIEEAAFPPGVVNIVNGVGPTVGAALASADGIDMVSFTGSTGAGRAVSSAAANSIKKVALELGGKSASLILEGADLPRAIKSTMAGCMLNNGQTCSALTRLLVPSKKLDEVKELLEAEIRKLVVGPSLDEGNRIGPLISSRQVAGVASLIASGMAQGATPMVSPSKVPEQGLFVSPQVFLVDSKNVLAQEEVFGPVLSVLTYETPEEGIRLANETKYGLAGAVWGPPALALDAAHQIRAGQVDINGARFNPLAPFGGFKQSGVGREGGVIGFEEFLDFKAIQLDPSAGSQ